MKEREISRDSALRGKVILNQHKRGYRFSIDAILLAWYSSALAGDKLLELGCGCGVCSLTLNRMRPGWQITAIELQEELVQLAELNIAENQADNIELINTDLKTLEGEKWQSKFDLVISNPPFRAVGKGRLNPDEQKAIARHELKATLEDFLRISRYCLNEQGYLALILLDERLSDLEKLAPANGLKILQRTDIKPFPDREPNLMLFLLGNPKAETIADSEISIWQEVQKYTEPVAEILEGNWDLVQHPLESNRPISN
jgi:tRNA1Val (adenine37-N6)-methyltransferase